MKKQIFNPLLPKGFQYFDDAVGSTTLSGDNYRTVLGDKGTALLNGADLLAKLTEVKALTPFGSTKSANNRVSLLIFPGVYDITGTPLLLDTEFVDICGIGNKEDVVIYSTAGTTVNISANDIKIKELTIQNREDSGSVIAVTLATSLPLNIWENLIITSIGHIMTTGITYSGTYINIKTKTLLRNAYTANPPFYFQINQSFGGSGSVASGTFKDVITEGGTNNSFGGLGTASGKFTNCIAICVLTGALSTPSNNSFGGQGVASGTFISCITNSTGSFGGAYYGCSFGGGVGGVASGYFLECSTTGYALNFSFGGATASGIFENITADGTYCFCGGAGASSGVDVAFQKAAGTCSGTFKDIQTAGGYCFSGGNGVNGGTLSGTFLDIYSIGFSFAGSNITATRPTMSGSFTNITAGANSFGTGGSIAITGRMINVSGVTALFNGVSISPDAYLRNIFPITSTGSSSFQSRLSGTIYDCNISILDGLSGGNFIVDAEIYSSIITINSNSTSILTMSGVTKDSEVSISIFSIGASAILTRFVNCNLTNGIPCLFTGTLQDCSSNGNLPDIRNGAKLINSTFRNFGATINSTIGGQTPVIVHCRFDKVSPYGANITNAVTEADAFNIKNVNI